MEIVCATSDHLFMKLVMAAVAYIATIAMAIVVFQEVLLSNTTFCPAIALSFIITFEDFRQPLMKTYRYRSSLRVRVLFNTQTCPAASSWLLQSCTKRIHFVTCRDMCCHCCCCKVLTTDRFASESTASRHYHFTL